MTNEQFTEIQISLSKIESKLNSLEAAVKEIKGSSTATVKSIKITPSPAYEELIKALEKDYNGCEFPKVNYALGVDKLN